MAKTSETVRKPREIPAALADWETFYREEFGITIDLSELIIPSKQEGFNRLVVVAKGGITPNRLFEACKSCFPSWRYRDDLNVITSTTLQETYAVWFRDRVEADEEMKNKSANDIAAERITGITLEERLLMELKCFKETGQHLDLENITLCTGSRYPDGCVPSVYWYGMDGRMSVYWCRPVDRDDGLRVRVAVR